MKSLIALLGIAALIIFFFAKKQKKYRDALSGNALEQSPQEPEKTRNEISYRRHQYLLTKAERSFYGILQAATHENYEIFLKVRIADVLKPETGSRSEWQTAFNKIAYKHFDFVICKKDTLEIVAAIELNDKSHESIDRKERDDFVRSACKSANLPLICIKAAAGYSIEKTRQLLNLIEKSNSK